jgi:hypothetical protein
MNWRGVVEVIFLLCISSSAQPQSMIGGQVMDLEGAVIANARIIVHWDPSGSKVGLSDNGGIQQDAIATTDAKGKYLIGVPAGFYDVFVSATAFTPTASKVRVKTGQLATHNVHLKVDPLVSRELAR